MSELTPLDDSTFNATLEATETGIILFHKQLCPHCKNMEKVLLKFSAKKPEVTLMTVDSEACPETMKQLNVERVPSLVIVKHGKPAHTKTGLLNPKELLALYASV